MAPKTLCATHVAGDDCFTRNRDTFKRPNKLARAILACLVSESTPHSEAEKPAPYAYRTHRPSTGSCDADCMFVSPIVH